MKKILSFACLFALLSLSVGAYGMDYSDLNSFIQTSAPSEKYYLVVEPSAYAPHMMVGVKEVARHGPYYDPLKRGSRMGGGQMGYVPDTYAWEKGISYDPYPNKRLPGLPARATEDRFIWMNY